MINCQPSISGILSSYQYTVTPTSAYIQVLTGGIYSSTNNPALCSLSYFISDLTGTVYSAGTTPLMIDSSGNVYIY